MLSTPKSRPTSSVGTSFGLHRKNSSASGILSTKTSFSQNRLFSAQSHRPSTSHAKLKPDLSITPFGEPSTSSSLMTMPNTAKSRPHSRGFKMSDLLSEPPTTRGQGQKDIKSGLSSIVETNKKTHVKGAKSYRSIELKEIKTDDLVEYEVPRVTPMSVKTQRSPRMMNYMKVKFEEDQKYSFIDVVSATIKERRKVKALEDRLQELQARQEKKEIVSKPIRHSDVELRLAKQEDIDAIENYENEILGTYKNYKDLKDITSGKVLNKIHYLKMLRVKLREDKQEVILTMIKGRNSIRQSLYEKDFKGVIHELKKVVQVVIKMDDVNLLMEALHLIGETYLDFGQLDNAVFALNQLRMGAELADNISKKIEAYLGLAEACKRLKYFDTALKMLNRALNFCWNVLDRERELKVYDQMGLIYFTTRDVDKAAYYHNRASQGRIQDEKSPLFIMANQETKAYRLKYHLSLQHIAPVFFTKLTIPNMRKKSVVNTKQGRERLRALLAHPTNKDKDDKDSFFEEEVTLNQASAFLEKVMTRVYYKQGITQTESPTLFNGINIGIEAIHQLEVMMGEADFSNAIPSPRTFDIKEKLMPDKQPRIFESLKDVKNEGYLLGNLDKRRKVMNSREYHNLKKSSGKYSLTQIARENNLTLKTAQGDIIMPFERKDLFVSFETLKSRAKKQYNSDTIETKLFLNHLSPNKSTHGIPNVPETKPWRYHKFFEMALEHIVYENEAKPQLSGR